ncbi:MAG TPA: PAS domain-containing protein, partial [bacterium]|nr:PAS domain-containing protein [bacterium]
MSNLRTLSIDSKRPPQTPIDAAQHDWLRVTLSSIGDGVITTDANGAVTFMNPVAESLTGWRSEEAAGLPLVDVFNIVNEETYLKVENPAILALRDGVVVGLANHTLLIARDGAARPIDDSAAPIRDTDGVVGGVVLVFRDVSTRRTSERLLRQAYAYSENIIATLRVPFLVLDGELEIKRANQAFYDSFRAVPAEVENLPLYEQGDGQWEIPELREVLNSVAQGGPGFEGLRIEGDFFRIGRRILVLNARRTCQPGNHADMILLAFEDVTEEQRAQDALVESERRYRRLFET